MDMSNLHQTVMPRITDQDMMPEIVTEPPATKSYVYIVVAVVIVLIIILLVTAYIWNTKKEKPTTAPTTPPSTSLSSEAPSNKPTPPASISSEEFNKLVENRRSVKNRLPTIPEAKNTFEENKLPNPPSNNDTNAANNTSNDANETSNSNSNKPTGTDDAMDAMIRELEDINHNNELVE